MALQIAFAGRTLMHGRDTRFCSVSLKWAPAHFAVALKILHAKAMPKEPE